MFLPNNKHQSHKKRTLVSKPPYRTSNKVDPYTQVLASSLVLLFDNMLLSLPGEGKKGWILKTKQRTRKQEEERTEVVRLIQSCWVESIIKWTIFLYFTFTGKHSSLSLLHYFLSLIFCSICNAFIWLIDNWVGFSFLIGIFSFWILFHFSFGCWNRRKMLMSTCDKQKSPLFNIKLSRIKITSFV